MIQNRSPRLNVNWTIKDVIFILIASLVFIFIASLLFLDTMKKNPFIGVFFLCIFIIILISILLRRRNEKWNSLGLVKKDNSRVIIKGILIGTILFFLTKLIFHPFSYFELFKSAFTPLKIFKCFLILLTFKGALDIFLIPFVEEVLFRGLLYQAFLNRFNRITSIIIVSAFDSLTHVDSFQNYKWLLIRFIYFISITWLFDRYKNLFLCISIHSTLNYLVWIVAVIVGTI